MLLLSMNRCLTQRNHTTITIAAKFKITVYRFLSKEVTELRKNLLGKKNGITGKRKGEIAETSPIKK
jgi:hypothetical protein